ncbi:MAG TPA: cytochrome P460 family protein [Candidatus Desulfaltia sp.]|nr:cytochrome P460 family protein [Candidatus Desulfaltia sp.]
MKKFVKFAGFLFLFLSLIILGAAVAEKKESFSPYVDEEGNIILPTDFRSNWVHLGSWVVPYQRDPGYGFHDVYTQPESLKAYRKSGRFPDGTVLVKEIHTVQWDDMPSGHVIFADEKSSWFVMVKESKGHFKDNPNWGDGWGWALFKASDPSKNVSLDYKKDCLSCHELAKATDWVYIQGYPTLR